MRPLLRPAVYFQIHLLIEIMGRSAVRVRSPALSLGSAS